MRRLGLVLTLAALAPLAAAGGAHAQAPPSPSLTVDSAFAPPGGISRGDFIPGTVADIPAAVAVHGDRIYTVGRTQGGSGGQDVGIMARRTDGTLDPAFSDDGRLIVAIAPGTEPDLGTGIAVLPDGRLRILAATDAVVGSGESLDVAILGVNPDGSPDTTFGAPAAAGAGRTGRIVFPAGPASDVPTAIALGPNGRLAVAGGRSENLRDDTFVSLREADGMPVDGFGTGGVRTLNRGGVVNGGSLIDRAVDVAFRPGGGVVALLLVETNPSAATDYAAVLHAFSLDGSDDATFSDDGDLVLGVGEPDTVPGGLVAHGGRLWAGGHTRVGADTDAFLARVDDNGGGFEFRRFDIRGRALASGQAAITRIFDLAIVSTDPATLVAAGAVDYTSDFGSTTTDWAAAAFNGLDGPLAAAGYGDVVLQAAGQGGLVGVAAGPGRSVAVAGTLVEATSADNSFGNARLLIDADKTCDLAVAVAEPAEMVFRGNRPGALSARVTNNGTRACAGTLELPAPYRLAPFHTGDVAPGATVTAAALPVTYAGPRRAQDIVTVTLTAPGDVDAANNRAATAVVFRFCDVSSRLVGAEGAIPTEGSRRFELVLRNEGTDACAVRLGTGPSYDLAAGRSVSDFAAVGAPRGARVGSRVRIVLRAEAQDDVEPGDNAVTVAPAVVRVGDSDVRFRGATRLSGTAKSGAGPLSRALLRPARVQVAVLRVGGRGCTWLTSARGGLTTRRPGPRGTCANPRWIRATGTTRWRLELRRALTRGRYVVYSRVTIRGGFAEARFTASDRNRIAFRVR